MGALGFAYHANLFFDQADTAMPSPKQLSGSEWRLDLQPRPGVRARGDASAAAGLRRVVERAPQVGTAWWRLGDAEFKLGRARPAEAAWGRAPAARPAAAYSRGSCRAGAPCGGVDLPRTRALGLARVALARGDVERARVLLEEATAAAPSFGPAVRLLGTPTRHWTRRGRARAVTSAPNVTGYDPYVDPTFETLVRESRSPTFLLQQAAAADAATNGQWREYLIRRALELDPDNADALFELATLLRVLRRFDEALPLLTRLQQPDAGRSAGRRRYRPLPLRPSALRGGRGDASPRAERSRRCEHPLRPWAGAGSDRPLRRGDRRYRRALERNPTHRDALNNLGVMLARGGRLGESVQSSNAWSTPTPPTRTRTRTSARCCCLRGAGARRRRVPRGPGIIDHEHAVRITPRSRRAAPRTKLSEVERQAAPRQKALTTAACFTGTRALTGRICQVCTPVFVA